MVDTGLISKVHYKFLFKFSSLFKEFTIWRLWILKGVHDQLKYGIPSNWDRFH